MNEHDATEMAYKNGFRNGWEAGVKKMAASLISRMESLAQMESGGDTFYLVKTELVTRFAVELLEDILK